VFSIRFELLGTGSHVSRGPYARVRLDGSGLVDDAGNVLAEYRDGYWQLGKLACRRFDIIASVHLQFLDNGQQRALGPFEAIHVLDTALHATETLAHLNRAAGKWLTFDDQGRWATIIIEPA
jgi:hypothetical protein